MWNKTHRRFAIVLWLVAGISASQFAQDNVYVSGYTKDLLSFTNVRGFGNFTDNLLHNRVNVEWYVNDHWTFKGALRNRLFVGDQPQNPLFLEALEEGANDFIDLSLSARIGEPVVFHTYLDRFYFEYSKDKLQVRLGRQRVNWGIHTTWNPNDIFNAFAFTDFDYEERPGSDALSVQYYTSALSSVELVIRAFEAFDEATIAGLWRTNRWNYDFQVLGGVVQNFVVLGGGWAGNMGDWGFKGEFSTFSPLDDEDAFTAAASIGWDYVFQGGLSLTFSTLYNSSGRTRGGLADLFDFELSARNLYPFRWSLLTSAGIQVHPLVTSALTAVYSPSSSHPLFLSPAVTWSATQDLDIDVVGQIAFNTNNGRYEIPIQAFFLRAKWSY